MSSCCSETCSTLILQNSMGSYNVISGLTKRSAQANSEVIQNTQFNLPVLMQDDTNPHTQKKRKKRIECLISIRFFWACTQAAKEKLGMVEEKMWQIRIPPISTFMPEYFSNMNCKKKTYIKLCMPCRFLFPMSVI